MSNTYAPSALALFSHWMRKPLQLITFLFGLALATALWSGVQAINYEARASYDSAASTLGEGRYDQLLPRFGDTIELSSYIKLRRNGWLVSPVTEGRLNGIRLIGIDPLTSIGGLPDLQRSDELSLRDFITRGMVFANAETRSKLNISVPIQVSPNVAPNVAVGDISVVQELLGVRHLTRLIVSDSQPTNRGKLADLAPELRLQETQQSADLGELTDSFHLNLTAFGLLSFAVGIFIVHSTVGLAFEQRRGSIRTLRALGVSINSLILALVCEILLLATLGATLGVLLGYAIAAALLPDVAATLRGLYGAEVAGTLQLRWEWWLSGFAIAMVGSMLAATGKLWQIATMPILAGAKPRAWVMAAGRGRMLQGLASTFLIVAAALLLQFGEGLLSGFLLLGCLLLGAALVLPVLLEKCLSFIQAQSRSVVAHWFWADTRQQVPGLSLALMALLLAIAANVGVSTMVSSFRLTFVEFLDQRLAPELYISIENPEKSAEVEKTLVKNADEVLLLYSRKGNVAGLPIEVDGIRVGQTHRDNWKFLAADGDVWERLAAGQVIVANEQFARRAGYWVGDLVSFENKELRLSGVVGDYGNPLGQITIGEALYRELYPGDRALRFGARTSDPAKLKDAIQAETNLPDSAFINQADIKSFSLRVFERTFTVTAALNILTLAVAGFAMLTSQLTLADLRVPQLAPVWALGLTRRELGRLEIIRTLVLAAVVCVLALPLGLALAWVLLAIVNVEAFGWRLPMFLFPTDYARLCLYALFAAFLAALWPAIRLARIAPNTLLKVFANEG